MNSLQESIQDSALVFHTKNLYRHEKVKTFKETLSFHLASNHSNYLNQMYCHIFYNYSCFTTWALTLLIMLVGITGKFGPEYWPITACITYLQALAK